MAKQSRTTLKGFFETGDTLLATSFEDLIDSCLNLAATSEQSMAGILSVPELVTPKVSATTMVVTSTFEAPRVSATNLHAVSADFTNAVIDTANITTVSTENSYATSANATNLRVNSKIFLDSSNAVVATGTSQASAFGITNTRSIITQASGVEVAVRLPNPEDGRLQIIVNDATSSALIYPASTFNIDGATADTAISIDAGQRFILTHGSSTYYTIKGA